MSQATEDFRIMKNKTKPKEPSQLKTYNENCKWKLHKKLHKQIISFCCFHFTKENKLWKHFTTGKHSSGVKTILCSYICLLHLPLAPWVDVFQKKT